jgi:hypothetical protein
VVPGPEHALAKLAGDDVLKGPDVTIRWEPLPERDLAGYVVEVVNATGRTRSTQEMRGTHALVRGFHA